VRDQNAELSTADLLPLRSGRHLEKVIVMPIVLALEARASSRKLSPSLDAEDCHPGPELRHRRPVAYVAGGSFTLERSMLYRCKLAVIRAGGAASSRGTIVRA
jgi:hypothetical protein